MVLYMVFDYFQQKNRHFLGKKYRDTFDSPLDANLIPNCLVWTLIQMGKNNRIHNRF